MPLPERIQLFFFLVWKGSAEAFLVLLSEFLCHLILICDLSVVLIYLEPYLSLCFFYSHNQKSTCYYFDSRDSHIFLSYFSSDWDSIFFYFSVNCECLASVLATVSIPIVYFLFFIRNLFSLGVSRLLRRYGRFWREFIEYTDTCFLEADWVAT